MPARLVGGVDDIIAQTFVLRDEAPSGCSCVICRGKCRQIEADAPLAGGDEVIGPHDREAKCVVRRSCEPCARATL